VRRALTSLGQALHTLFDVGANFDGNRANDSISHGELDLQKHARYCLSTTGARCLHSNATEQAIQRGGDFKRVCFDAVNGIAKGLHRHCRHEFVTITTRSPHPACA